MRNSDIISWPHPVLGNSEDIDGSFNVKIVGAINNKELSLKTEELNIDNDYFKKLLEEKRATLIYKLSCNSTLFMQQIEDNLDHNIDCTLLSNKLSIEVLIVAKEDIDKYTHDSFHEDTKLGENKGVFKIEKGTIIGDAGSVTIPLNNEYRKGISGIIEFQRHGPDEPILIDADGPKIIVKYPNSPSSQNIITTFTSGRKQFVNVFLSLFVIPALTEAFRILIEAKADNSYDEKIEDYDWARVIHENMNDPITASDNSYEMAQIFLKEMTQKKSGIVEPIPVFRAFNEIFK